MPWKYSYARGELKNCLDPKKGGTCEITMDGINSSKPSYTDMIYIDENWFAQYGCSELFWGVTHNQHVMINHRKVNPTVSEMMVIYAKLAELLPEYDLTDLVNSPRDEDCEWKWEFPWVPKNKLPTEK